MEKMLIFLQKVMALKNVERAGWNKDIEMNGKRYFCSVPNAESDADHTWSTALMAMLLLTQMNRDDKFEILAMILIHDIPEIISGDPMTPFLNKREIKQKDKSEVSLFAELISDLPEETQNWLNTLFLEYIEQQTWRSRFVKACDYSDPITQAFAYALDPDNTVDPVEFLETNIPKIEARTPDIAESLTELAKDFLSRKTA